MALTSPSSLNPLPISLTTTPKQQDYHQSFANKLPPPPTASTASLLITNKACSSRSSFNAHHHHPRRDSDILPLPLPLFPSLSLPHHKLEPSCLHLAAASTVLCLAVGGARACTSSPQLPAPLPPLLDTVRDTVDGQAGKQTYVPESVLLEDDQEMKAAFERWKSKPYALTVPLRIVSLRGSVPPSWFKEFAQVQGRRLKLQSEFRARLEDVFSELSLAAKKGSVDPKSAMAADLITLGDSWLSLAISKGLIEPIKDAEVQDWFKGLSDRWKVYLRRNCSGNLELDGKIWAVPYRWGCMVIAYKKNKFREYHMAPVEDWCDLWRPELAGKISMVDSPREIVGAVLKYMGASYNTRNIEVEVPGGKNSTMEMLKRLQKQVLLFDSVNYLKSFGVGDTWVAVGWSSDVFPAAKRMSNVAVVVPKSGSSLWADLWAVPATNKLSTNRVGGRVRGPSPLVHQWMEFCLQTARALPFQEEVIPGAAPTAIERVQAESGPLKSVKGPKLETNLIAGVPPSDILAKCEFLEPLSKEALMDHQWLIGGIQTSSKGWIEEALDYSLDVCSLVVQQVTGRANPKKRH